MQVGEPAAMEPVAQAKKVVVLREAATDGENPKTGEEIRALVTRIPDVRTARLRVNRVSAIKKGVVLELKDEESMRKLMASEGIKNAGLVATPLEARRPEVRVYDVPKGMSDEEILKDVTELNLEPGKDWGSEVKIGHRLNQREKQLCSVILTVSPRARVELLKVGRVSIELRSCRVVDHTRAARCYKCQKYGHVSRNCRSEGQVCVHCGGANHVAAQCKKREQPPKCVNCRHAGVAAAHRADSKDCPQRAKALSRTISRTQYAVGPTAES
jgi:hypothetical protein